MTDTNTPNANLADAITSAEIRHDLRDLHTRISATGHPSNMDVLTVTTAPASTYSIDNLGATATAIISADRIGFHVEPAVTGAGNGAPPRDRADYLTVAPTYPAGPVILLQLGEGYGPRVLDAIEAAIADGLAGDLHLTLYHFGGAGYPWHVTGAAYFDAEGDVHP